MTAAQLDGLAGDVLATLAEAPPGLLRVFASGLAFADGPVGSFSTPLEYLADNIQAGEPAGQLTRLSMRYALRRAALEGSLISRLADAQQPFWRTVGNAATVIAEDLLPAG